MSGGERAGGSATSEAIMEPRGGGKGRRWRRRE